MRPHYVLQLVLAVSLMGCSSSPPASPALATPAAPGPAVQVNLAQPLVATRDGQEDFRIQEKAGELEVVWKGGQGKAKVEADRVKLLDGDKLLAKAKSKDNGFELEDGSGARLLRFKLKGKPALKVEDGKDQVVMLGDNSAGGFDLTSSAGASLGRIERSGEGLAWKKAALQGTTDLEVGIPLACESLTPAQRACLVIYLAKVRR